jgi:hypothetical protein
MYRAPTGYFDTTYLGTNSLANRIIHRIPMDDI